MTTYTVLIEQTWQGERIGDPLSIDIIAESPEEAARRRVEALIPASRDLPRRVHVVAHSDRRVAVDGFRTTDDHYFVVDETSGLRVRREQ